VSLDREALQTSDTQTKDEIAMTEVMLNT